MFNKIAQISVCALVMGGVLYSTTALAEGSTLEISKSQVEEKCEADKGRFTTSWAYNDQGITWGEIYTCEALTYTLACQDGLCVQDDELFAANRVSPEAPQ